MIRFILFFLLFLSIVEGSLIQKILKGFKKINTIEKDVKKIKKDVKTIIYGEETTAPTSTVCVTKNGEKCIFPFMEDGNTFTSCTTYQAPDEPWCATAVDNEGVMTNWGSCDLNTCTGPIIPGDFKTIDSLIFEFNGEEHEQEVFYHEEKKEAVLHSPAHAGIPATTTVLTSKDGDKKAQSLSCDSTICHLNDVHDDLYYDPEIIAHVYNLLATSRSTRKIRVADSAKINYVVRSNHQLVSAAEIDNLPESMKAVSSGKSIMFSETTILTERPNTNFTFDYRRKSIPDGEGRTYCGDRYGCGSTNEMGCSWSFKFTTKPQAITPADTVHSIAFDNFCITCCSNSDSFPDYNRYVLCDDITKPSYYVRRQAFNTAVAVTYRETQGPASIQCGQLYPEYIPGCKHYGNHHGGLGACVKTKTDPCPPEREPPVWN